MLLNHAERKRKNLRGVVKNQAEKELLQHLGDSEEEEEKEENQEVLRLKAKLDKRAGKIRRLKAENEGLRKLNQELQLALCTKVLEKVAEEDSLAKNEIVDDTIGLQNEDGMIHVGQGVYINPESWEEMQKAETDSMFCKITASSIWPVDILLERSVTGTVSNKAKAAGQEKAFAPLTPHKVKALSGSLCCLSCPNVRSRHGLLMLLQVCHHLHPM
ncbi:hypothetical protein HPB47_026541 [Ixodes persulcatus]|uniref:Uncharacterized protein n=1 Tax=Ixodes persulcatus TaxID=34615 RepID=A0AC60PYG6_IXOPE|nr:hypothetical protein HPB47_026541 [Ixodes persulcatus]